MSHPSQRRYLTSTVAVQSGFTLIELMVVLMILAIVATIAVPTYRQYMVRNAEHQSTAKMKQLQTELESWRANTLSYKGFYPRKVQGNNTTYSYDASDDSIYVPGPDVNHAKYTIKLTDNAGNSLTADDASANNWVMFAEPNADMREIGARNILITNTGIACIGATSNTTDCKQSDDEVGLSK